VRTARVLDRCELENDMTPAYTARKIVKKARNVSQRDSKICPNACSFRQRAIRKGPTDCAASLFGRKSSPAGSSDTMARRRMRNDDAAFPDLSAAPNCRHGQTVATPRGRRIIGHMYPGPNNCTPNSLARLAELFI